MFRTIAFRNVTVCIMISLLLVACSTRHYEEPCRIHLKDGESIYEVITDHGDTLSFPNHGAEYHDGIIQGILADGSEKSIDVDSVSLIEVSHFNMVKTSLYTVGIIALLAGALVTLAAYEFVHAL